MSEETSLNLCHPDTVGWMRKAWDKTEGNSNAELQWHLIAAVCCQLASLRDDINCNLGHLATVVGETNQILHQGLQKGR